MSKVNAERRAAEQRTFVNFVNHLEFETLISELSTKFINLRSDDIDRGLEDALRLLCKCLGIDIAVRWQWSLTDPGVITLTHAYVGEGMPALGALSQERFPWFVEQMRVGRAVATSSLWELPAAADVDRENLRLLPDVGARIESLVPEPPTRRAPTARWLGSDQKGAKQGQGNPKMTGANTSLTARKLGHRPLRPVGCRTRQGAGAAHPFGTGGKG